jgi:putative Mn2+ efflux pump MntP
MNNLMDLLRKALFGILVVAIYFFLLGTSYDLLTKANTISNILGFIGVTILLILGMLFIYNAIKIMIESSDLFSRSEYEKQKDEEWKEHILKQMEEMQKMHKENESLKKKSKHKPKTK